MVSGTDEHGTPIQVQADKEGVSARELADRYNGVIAQDLHGLGMSYDLFTRTTTRNHYAVVQEIFKGLHDNGYIFPKTHDGRDLAVHRPHAARPLHRGHLPDLRLRRRARRPVRQLRQPARPDRPDQPACRGSTARRRSSSRPSTSSSTCPRSPRRSAPGCRQGGRSGGRTSEVRAEPAGRPAARRDQPRPRLGRADAAARAGATGRDKRLYVWFDAVIGYLSASVEWARRSGDPDAWRAWWQNPDAQSYYFMGKDNIVFHAEIWPAMLLGYNGEGDRGGKPGSLGELNLPTEVVSSEFLTMEGKKFSSSRQVVIYVQRLPRALRRGRAALLRRRRRARRPRTPTSPGRSSSAATTTSWSPRGATSSTARSRSRPRTSARSRRRATLTDADRGAARAVAAALRGRRRASWSGRGSRARSPRRCEVVARRTSTCPTRRRGSCKDRATRSGATDPARRAAGRRRRQDAADAVPAATPPRRCTSCSAAQGAGAACREIQEVEEEGGPAYPVLTGDYADRRRAGSPRRSRPGAPLAPPTPLFTKLDPSVVDEELARLEQSE